MEWGKPLFVLAIIAITMGGWLINNLIRARHGYPLEDQWGGKTAPSPAANTENQRLRAENEELKAHLAKLEDRTRVLERIVTDSGYRTAAQIEALRDEPTDSGVPLALAKERV
jgi:hypothetical protein